MTSTTLLISVGGAPGPIVYSIQQNRPEKVIFFVSKGSRSLVSDQILPQLLASDPGRLLDHEFVVTPDEQDVGVCVFSLMQEVPAALSRLNVTDSSWPHFVDYTGGTKAMSAAMVWASSRFPCKMSYVGTSSSEGRIKNGMGIVMDGKELCFLQENPWNRIAFIEARSAIDIFNHGQYGNAAAIMKSLAERVTEDLPSRMFQTLAELFEGFYLWDIFDHRGAQKLLYKNLNLLCVLAEVPQVLFPGLKELSKSVRELLEVLDGIKPGEKSCAIVRDLLANAQRRAQLERKYEDATARCYSAIEKIAQYELLSKYGIDTGNARPERIPDPFREEYTRRYEVISREPGKAAVRRIQFGLYAAMDLLKYFDNPTGIRFAERKLRIRGHLAERNSSILAHGAQPMNNQRYRDLFEDARYLLDINESALTQFPVLKI
jgi:CRISPR-associated protein (TIGR02710 family)